MKQIQIFWIVLLVAILALPLDALACDELRATRDTAKEIRDDAQKELDDLVRTAFTAIGTLTLVPPPVNPGRSNHLQNRRFDRHFRIHNPLDGALCPIATISVPIPHALGND